MRVVLLEPSYTSETRESAGDLIPMKNTKISKPQGEFPPGTWAMIKHQTERKDKIQIKKCIEIFIKNIQIFLMRINIIFK